MTQQTLNHDEKVIAEARDGTRLIAYQTELPTKILDDGSTVFDVTMRELDQEEGAVVFLNEDADEIDSRMEFEKFSDARLAFGLWIECGPFMTPESSRSVPREVAVAGQDYITTWIHLNNGFPIARDATASICDVSKQTVTDRLSRVRWKPNH